MNRTFTIFSLLFLLLVQVFICNNIYFFGFINPYVYVFFIFLFPLNKNRFIVLSIAFLYGLLVDFFSDTGGIHAFSLVFVSYLRLFFIKIFFKKSDIDYLLFNFNSQPFGKVFNYVVTLILLHHFVMFLLANFSLHNFTEVLLNTFFSAGFTITLYFLGSFIFRKRVKTY